MSMETHGPKQIRHRGHLRKDARPFDFDVPEFFGARLSEMQTPFHLEHKHAFIPRLLNI